MINQQPRPLWLRALGMAGGAAAYIGATLYVIRGLAAWLADGRIVPPGSGIAGGAFFFGAGFTTLVAFFLLRRKSWMRGRSCGATLVWLLGYLIVWAVGLATGGLSLPIFLVLCLLIGLLSSLLLPAHARTTSARSRPATHGATAPSRQVVQRAEFGRVPVATVVLLSQHVRTTLGPVLGELPVDAPLAVRAFTTRRVLDGLLRDWWENRNTEGLRGVDIADIQSFVRLALAAATTGQLPLSHPAAQAAYRGLLAALLDDWLHNWNANGAEGPPQRS